MKGEAVGRKLLPACREDGTAGAAGAAALRRAADACAALNGAFSAVERAASGAAPASAAAVAAFWSAAAAHVAIGGATAEAMPAAAGAAPAGTAVAAVRRRPPAPLS
ncbi:hypothetical protein JKP88DRAFT_280435 [Tribonema minus]|uniref:Uncharacterized protein n=1 Tax=Tribonema minus TaxID=303371 RepID=A0A836CBE6_9STRA|nr:hypothetical protein JKP88DRAFT_280435 [Tribonema minus]